jgi:hypothetical protein
MSLKTDALNRLASKERSCCSEWTGNALQTEHCCTDWKPAEAGFWGSALPGDLPGGAEVVRRLASLNL